MKIYCIKDTKAGFMNPFYLQNDEIATRTFKKAANDKQPNAVNDFPEDKELYCLGEFDERTGTIKGDEPRFMLRAVDCIVKVSENKGE